MRRCTRCTSSAASRPRSLVACERATVTPPHLGARTHSHPHGEVGRRAREPVGQSRRQHSGVDGAERPGRGTALVRRPARRARRRPHARASERPGSSTSTVTIVQAERRAHGSATRARGDAAHDGDGRVGDFGHAASPGRRHVRSRRSRIRSVARCATANAAPATASGFAVSTRPAHRAGAAPPPAPLRSRAGRAPPWASPDPRRASRAARARVRRRARRSRVGHRRDRPAGTRTSRPGQHQRERRGKSTDVPDPPSGTTTRSTSHTSSSGTRDAAPSPGGSAREEIARYGTEGRSSRPEFVSAFSTIIGVQNEHDDTRELRVIHPLPRLPLHGSGERRRARAGRCRRARLGEPRTASYEDFWTSTFTIGFTDHHLSLTLASG